jgi:hypothetical protein
LPGHSAQITVVKHLPSRPSSTSKGKGKDEPRSRPIVSGDEEGNISYWQTSASGTEYEDRFKYDCRWSLKAHEGAISSLGVFTFDDAMETGLLLTGGNDGSVKVFSWKFEEGQDVIVEELQTIKFGGRLPLDLAISYLPDSQGEYDTRLNPKSVRTRANSIHHRSHPRCRSDREEDPIIHQPIPNPLHTCPLYLLPLTRGTRRLGSVP